ncbi:prohibitin family protein [Tateyamaria sp.]|nr:prohibitin family protein [Tateyamaria sp.]
MKNPIALVAAGITSLALLLGAVSSAYTVDEGHVGVVTKWGKAVAQEPAAGLKFKNPITTSIIEVDVRERQSKDEMRAGTTNQLPITAVITTNWSMDPDRVLEIYRKYGSPEQFDARIMDGRLRDAAKAGLGKFQVSELINDRSAASAEILGRVREALEAYPVMITSIQIEDVVAPPTYTEAVLEKEREREAAAKEQYILERQATTSQQTVQTANAERDATMAAADGQAYRVRTEAAAAADAIRAKGEAQAEAINAMQTALENNPLVIEYEKARRWNGQMPQTMLGSDTNMLMRIN